MKLNRKLRWIVYGFIIFSLVVVSTVVHFITLDHYRDVEVELFKNELETLNRILLAEMEDIKINLEDWSNWDQPYSFIDIYDESFIQENLIKETYELMKLNYILILDDKYELVYGEHFDGEKLNSIDDETLNLFKKFKGQNGLIEIGENAVIFTSAPINTSNKSSVPKGLMVFCRTMNEDNLEKLSYRLNHEFKLESGPLEKDLKVVNDYGFRNDLIYSNNDISQAIVWIPMLNDESYYTLTFDLENRVQSLGKTFQLENFIITLIILICFGVLLDYLFRYVVINRIIGLNDQINDIRLTSNLASRVNVKGVDEIGELSHSINDMLEEIESMHGQVILYAEHDIMTGVYSRKKGFELLEKDFELAKNSDSCLCIIYFDVDDLKQINDTHGHAMGDQLIMDAVQMINCVASNDSYSMRLGGDEFLTVIPNGNDEEVYDMLERLDENIEMFNKSKKRSYQVSLSYGISCYTDEITVDEFVESADEKMYAFKNHRKNTRAD